MSILRRYIGSSIGKKQIVAVSGLLLILFLVAHLAGNLLIYKGPVVFNHYAEALRSMTLVFYIINVALIAIFGIHIVFTVMVVKENIQARKKRYEVQVPAAGKRPLSTRTMAITGPLILTFLIIHLVDFTFTKPELPQSLFKGIDLGLYGLIVNSFMNPVRSVFYIVAMFAIGLHLAHAFQSVCQTFGWNHPRYMPFVRKLSLAVGIIISVGFSTIPVYMYFFIGSAR